MTRTYEAVARAIAAHGVHDVFGLMGEGNMSLIYHLTTDHGVTFHATRREDAAVAAANGFARVSGRVGVATVTHGPGLTNTVSALTEAVHARHPVVLLAGDTHTTKPYGPQVIDQEAVVAPTGAGFVRLRSATAYDDVALAFRRAVTESRPIVLNLPLDVQNLEFDGPVREPVALRRAVQVPDPASIEAAAAVLRRAQAPVVLLGRGAVAAGARSVADELAERIGAVLATTLMAKGYAAGHPFDAGVSGGYAHRAAQDLLPRADVVLSLGASLNDFTTDHGRMFPDAEIVQVDVEAAAFGRWLRPTVEVLGDARLVAEALTKVLDGNNEGLRPAAGELATWTARDDHRADEATGSGMDLRSFFAALDDAVPAQRTVVVGGGHYTSEACRILSVPTPEALVFSIQFGCIGLGLANMLGAAVGAPDRIVLGIEGDGGATMSLGELERIVASGLPIALVIMDDAAYGAEYHVLKASGRETTLSEFAPVDFTALVIALGGDVVRIEDPSQVPALRERLADLRRPLVVHAVCDVRIRSDWYRGRAGDFAREAVGTVHE